MDRICRYPKCAQVFTPHRTQLYCSVRCRDRWERERYRKRRNELNRRWKKAHPEAGRRHNLREHARDRKFLQVPKPQGLNMAQIKMLEQVLGKQAQQWANQHIVRLTHPVSWRDDQEVRDLRARLTGT